MGTTKKSKIYNVTFIIVLIVLIIPQTRLPIQVFMNKAIALIIKPSVIDVSERKTLIDYNWKLKDTSNNTYDFSSAKGKVVVINFWATWCPPCIAEMPSLEALFQSYKGNKDVVFLFVSNEEKEKLYEFMINHNFSFQVYQSVSAYPKNFNVSSIPRTFIIDRNGTIVIDKSGAANWNSNHITTVIDELLIAF
ncbi:TlpA disulfide reductase family protein [uncultured Psychroserpens sp.]|uniref:TlpA family protein disulfide reductase n=1 Tax=uncultured Psychroserpens sp. TaxID=255436 RepID=UPI0026101EA3|nr:TlpA disulfide reductase family protein [uncultured Psychroserpens sp.]